MKIRKLLLPLALLACCSPAWAQSHLKAILKDGSELTGYISRQRPGEDFTFSTSRATIFMPASKAKSMLENEVKYNSLSEEWKKWADENNAVTGAGDARTVTLTDILTDDGTISRVRVLEKGAKIKYLEIAPNSYALNWDTVTILRCDKRDPLLLTGINRKYRLKSGIEYEGEFVEEKIGETLSLYKKNGITEVISTLDVVKDSRMKLNPDQTLFEQSDLIDIVTLKNGSTYRGIIFEKNYFGYDDMDSDELKKTDASLIKHDFLLIQLEDEQIVSVNLQDIIEYRKEPNPKYSPLTDILLNEGEFVVNRQKTQPQQATEEAGFIRICADSVATSIIKNTPSCTATIETRFANALQAQQFKLVKARKYATDKKKKTFFYAFTYEDLAKLALLQKKDATSINGTCKMEYSLDSPGLYILYNPSSKLAIPFWVKNNSAR